MLLSRLKSVCVAIYSFSLLALNESPLHSSHVKCLEGGIIMNVAWFISMLRLVICSLKGTFIFYSISEVKWEILSTTDTEDEHLDISGHRPFFGSLRRESEEPSKSSSKENTHAYTYMHIHICMYTCSYICIHMHKHTLTCTHAHNYVYIHTYTHKHACTCIYIWSCTHTNTHALSLNTWFFFVLSSSDTFFFY